MKQYKPEYLGKVIPADDPTKLTNFVQNQYDAFSLIYDTCKSNSETISEIKTVENPGADASSLSVKIMTDRSVLDNISEKIKEAESQTVKITGDVITAKA